MNKELAFLPTTDISDDFIKRYLTLDKEVKEKTKERDAMKEVLKARGIALETDTLTTETYTVKLTEMNRYSLDTKLIKADFPEIYEVYGHNTPWTKITIKNQ